MNNSSGQGSASEVPAEIRGWNWGAFFLNWIWGIGNNTLIALLMFVPLVNFVMIFVLGARGNEWAWRNKRWEDVAQFRRVQRNWALAGAVLWVAAALFSVVLFFGLTAAMKQSEAYQMASAAVAQDTRVQQQFGTPLAFGTPMGSIEVNGPTGSAKLSFSIEGPRGRGTVFVEAEKRMGRWEMHGLAVQPDDSTPPIPLIE